MRNMARKTSRGDYDFARRLFAFNKMQRFGLNRDELISENFRSLTKREVDSISTRKSGAIQRGAEYFVGFTEDGRRWGTFVTSYSQAEAMKYRYQQLNKANIRINSNPQKLKVAKRYAGDFVLLKRR